MKYKPNWNETMQRFTDWWKGDLHETPLFSLFVNRNTPHEPLEPVAEAKPGEHYYSDMPVILTRFRNQMRMQNCPLDTYPSLDLNFGPGSLALYLGCEPIFSPETVWFKPCVHNGFGNYPLVYDKNNHWWREHYRILEEAQKAANGDFFVNIPDLVENLDILAAMRNPEELCIDLLDEPEIIKQRLEELNKLFFVYYDALYDLLKGKDGSSSFTAFRVWGPGKTAKIQCDFNVLMSPEHFKEFAVPTFVKQCAALDNSIFHLDGPDAIRHAPALMEIEKLDALQWTPGAGNPDGGSERWYPLYDIVHEAGKCLWVYFEDSDADTIVAKARKLVKRYGIRSLYINVLPWVSESEADIIIKAAANGFK